MELRTTYSSRQAACDAIATCTAKPGDVVVWDVGTTSRLPPRPELWPALLVSLVVADYPEMLGYAVHALITIPGDVRTRRVHARIIRLPKRARTTEPTRQATIHASPDA